MSSAATAAAADSTVVGCCMLCRKTVISTEPNVVCDCKHPLTNYVWHARCASDEAERRGKTIRSTCDVCKTVLRVEDTSWLPGDTWSRWLMRVAVRWGSRVLILAAVSFAVAFFGAYAYKLYASARSLWLGHGIPREFALPGSHNNSTLHSGWHPGRQHMTLGLCLGYKLLIYGVVLYLLWLIVRFLLFPAVRWLLNWVRLSAFAPRYRSTVIPAAAGARSKK